MINNLSLNKCEPNLNIFPSDNLSFKDIGIYTERSIMDDYNIFLLEYMMSEKQFFESILLKEDESTAVSTNVDRSENNKTETSNDKSESNDKAKAGFTKSIGEWLKTIWEKIKGFFVKLINKVKSIYDEWKKKNDAKLAEKFVQAINNINDEDFYVKVISIEYLERVISNCSTGSKLIQQYTLEAEKDYSDEIDPNEFREKYSKDKIVQRLYGDDTLGFDSIQSISKFFTLICKFKKKETTKMVDHRVDMDIFGDFSEKLEIDQIKRDKNHIVNIAFNNNKWIQVLNKNYTDCKSFVESCKKGANNMIKDLDKDSDNRVLLKEFITGCNNCIAIILKLSALNNQVLQEIRLNYLSCINKCIVQAKKEAA